DDAACDLFNLVGFQTNLRWPDQRRLFRSLPGLANAEFARLGVLHRNTYVNSPALLAPSHRLRSTARTYLAGQLVGVEGYLESAMSGLVAALNVAAAFAAAGEVIFPDDTAIGSLVRYVTTPQREFAPMNATGGLFPPLDDPLRHADKRERARSQLARARPSFARFLASRPDLVAAEAGTAAEALAGIPCPNRRGSGLGRRGRATAP